MRAHKNNAPEVLRFGTKVAIAHVIQPLLFGRHVSQIEPLALDTQQELHVSAAAWPVIFGL